MHKNRLTIVGAKSASRHWVSHSASHSARTASSASGWGTLAPFSSPGFAPTPKAAEEAGCQYTHSRQVNVETLTILRIRRRDDGIVTEDPRLPSGVSLMGVRATSCLTGHIGSVLS